MYTCILKYVYMQDIYVYMQDNYVYIITYNFFTQVKIYVVQWKTYVVMSLQGHRIFESIRLCSHIIRWDYLKNIWKMLAMILSYSGM